MFTQALKSKYMVTGYEAATMLIQAELKYMVTGYEAATMLIQAELKCMVTGYEAATMLNQAAKSKCMVTSEWTSKAAIEIIMREEMPRQALESWCAVDRHACSERSSKKEIT
jgi:hypothetical protein